MELMEAVTDEIPENEPIEVDENEIRISIIGRPNVGKSSLVNRLLDSSRCIVSDKPGTTRDAIDSPIEVDGQKYVLIDTAGIRRKGKTVQVLEKFSVIMSLKALERCHIAVLVIDGDEGLTEQDATIIGYAVEKGRGCIVLVNKWDLAKNKYKEFADFKESIQNKLKFLDFAPFFAVSAKTGYNLQLFFPKINQVFEGCSKRVATGPLNDCFEKAIERNPFSSFRGKLIKLFYSAQVRNCPPTFRCFINYPQGIHFSYKRYLINSLRKKFGFHGTPVRLLFSRRKSK
jgi:GTP-binding protein